jgi:hypothetical protein
MVSGLSLLRETDGTGDNSDDAVKTYVDAYITIDPDGVNPVNDPHTFTVTLWKDLGQGAGFVRADGEHVDFTLTDTDGASFVLDGPSSTCDDAGPNTDGSGQCTIVFTSPTAGFTTGHAWSTLTVGGVSLFRETDGVSPNSDDAVKEWIESDLCLLIMDEEALDNDFQHVEWAASYFPGVTPGELINDEGPGVPTEVGNPHLLWNILAASQGGDCCGTFLPRLRAGSRKRHSWSRYPRVRTTTRAYTHCHTRDRSCTRTTAVRPTAACREATTSGSRGSKREHCHNIASTRCVK